MLIDENVILLVLQSITRATLSQRSLDLAMRQPSMNAQCFAAAAWREQGLTATELAAVLARLELMFPGSGASRSAYVASRYGLDSQPGEAALAVFQAWQLGKRQIVYQSSGSSGIPKELPHSLDEVEQEVAAVAALFGEVKNVISVTPQYHCYGFIFGVLLPRVIGAKGRYLPPLPSLVAQALAPHTLLVGYPDLWQRLETAGGYSGQNVICLSAGSPWPEDDMQRLLQHGLGVCEIYGSSENGAVGYRRGPGDFTLVSYWRRSGASGAPGANGGETLLRVPPTQVHAQMPPSAQNAHPRVWQDEVQWSGPGSFRPLKRLDNAVQVSGANVYPARVAELLASHSQVADCRVRLMQPQEGRRLKAFVVPRPGADESALRKELRKLCRERLLPPERPASFSFGEKLPLNDFGKVTDWPIRR